MKRGYVDTHSGQLHYVTHGEGEPLLLLHQSARSWKSFSKLMQILAPRYKMVAIDFPGFGESEPFTKDFTLSDISKGIIQVLDALKINKFRIFGHHSGAAIAGDIAAMIPDRVQALVMSGYPFMESEAERQSYLKASNITMGTAKQPGAVRSLPVMALEQDGTHLVRLWQRASMRLWQGKGSIPYDGITEEELEFIQDWVSDAIKARKSAPVTFDAVWRYESQEKLPKVKAPTLLIQLTGPYERDICQRAHLVQPLVKGSKLMLIENGDIYMIYWRAQEVAEILTSFFKDPAGFQGVRLPARAPK